MDVNEKLRRLQGKGKTYKIGGEEFTLIPLKMKRIDLLVEMEKSGGSLLKLIKETFKNSYPDIDEKLIDEISLTYSSEIGEAIIDLHGLDIPDKK